MGVPEGVLKECAGGWGQTRTSTRVHTGAKAMFPLITGSPLAGRSTATHCIVVPSASCTCQAANLSEIESEQSARNILKSCMTRDYMFSHFCRISDSKIDCIRGTLTPVKGQPRPKK